GNASCCAWVKVADRNTTIEITGETYFCMMSILLANASDKYYLSTMLIGITVFQRQKRIYP
ncbi:MAG: hypothetical protein V3T31_12020, partial [candidate division Zixibacteria bacterium]